MPFLVKRILLKSGELLTERELEPGINFFEGLPPVVGDVIIVECRGRSFPARVVTGNWPGRNETRDPATVVPLRVEEL